MIFVIVFYCYQFWHAHNNSFVLIKFVFYGKRINIRVEIFRKDNDKEVNFITGWSVLPNGKIKLNTPYGGK